ncbi:12439_t:CDS:2 [Acaulospora morrowiae]|uniref:Holocytochrome c-type synthase n=1 Tax=Acaulospora morrowiae TaxID=94023 RepID=A0A9N9AY74_9GLOM|nr:12439_t:CDS:2 [Acaulospora morrowiae]
MSETVALPNSTEVNSCPVNHSVWTHFVASETSKNESNNADSCECPHVNRQIPSTSEKGCTSDAINESNNMPLLPNQKPSADQRFPLDTSRQLSNIPRATPKVDKNSANKTEEEVWIYPSEQMFFNAMKRKNWKPREEDMRVVVPIHNAVNEKAWKEILEWEKLHVQHCGEPKLVKFQGRANDITPKARLLNLLGYKLPFDRHDWVIDRCGKRVTYVIDFYAGQPNPEFPQNVSFYLDVRPALTLEGVLDRFRRFLRSIIE